MFSEKSSKRVRSTATRPTDTSADIKATKGALKWKNPKDMIRVDTQHIKPEKVALAAAGGLLLGGVLGLLSQIVKLDVGDTSELDPASPNMKERDPELCTLFKKLMNDFYVLCPDRNKEKYRHRVSNAIAHAEAVMLIENQLSRGEIPRSFEQISKASAHALLCVESLRKVQDLFDTHMFSNVSDLVDVVVVKLCDHDINVRILASLDI